MASPEAALVQEAAFDAPATVSDIDGRGIVADTTGIDTQEDRRSQPGELAESPPVPCEQSRARSARRKAFLEKSGG